MIAKASRLTASIVFAALLGLLAILVIANAQASSEDERQSKVSGETIEDWYDELGPKIEKIWPETYAWIWYPTPGNPQDGVEIGFTEDAKGKVEELASDFPRPELLHPFTAPVSAMEIRRRILIVAQDRDGDRNTLVEQVRQPFDIQEDLRTGEVVVVMKKPNAEIEKVFAERYPFPVRVEEGGLGSFGSCSSRADCGLQLRAGIQSRRLTDPNRSRCSIGFTVLFNGNRQVLSAGHCSLAGENGREPGELRYHGSTDDNYGVVRQIKFGNSIDVERIGIVANPAYLARPWIYVEDNFQDDTVDSQGSFSGLLNGQTVCRAGIATNRRCGPIQYKFFTPEAYNETLTDFVKFGACSSNGDSGGPVFRDGKALGIYAGWVQMHDDPSCLAGSGTSSYFGAIDRVLNAVNATLVTVP